MPNISGQGANLADLINYQEGKMRKGIGLILAVVFTLAATSVFAQNSGLSLGGLDKDAKKAQIEEKKLTEQAQKDAEKAKKKAEKELKKKQKEAEERKLEAQKKAEKTKGKARKELEKKQKKMNKEAKKQQKGLGEILGK